MKKKPLEKEQLSEAVALILKHTQDLSENELKALHFSIWVEYCEREEEWRDSLNDDL